jgi:hypothetical protein
MGQTAAGRVQAKRVGVPRLKIGVLLTFVGHSKMCQQVDKAFPACYRVVGAALGVWGEGEGE